jgi:hypothetical protein
MDVMSAGAFLSRDRPGDRHAEMRQKDCCVIDEWIWIGSPVIPATSVKEPSISNVHFSRYEQVVGEWLKRQPFDIPIGVQGLLSTSNLSPQRQSLAISIDKLSDH